MAADQQYRTETDTMGEIKVPYDAYYGAQTQRAVENFPISGITFPSEFVYALALIKKCAAEVNFALGLLEQEMSTAIAQAAGERAPWDLRLGSRPPAPGRSRRRRTCAPVRLRRPHRTGLRRQTVEAEVHGGRRPALELLAHPPRRRSAVGSPVG